MLQARYTPMKLKDEEIKTYADDISITPLGIPMLCGPGAIANAIVLMQDAHSYEMKGILIGTIALIYQAVIDMLKQINIPYITATHDVNNPRSGKVMQAIGMKYQYSYEEYWQPKLYLVTFRMYQLNFDDQQDRVYKKYWNKYPVHFIEEI